MNELLSLRIAMVCAIGLAAMPVPALAQQRPSSAENFPIGNSGAVCEAQGVSLRGSRSSIFDRKWALLCRDAEGAVGWAYRYRSNAPVGGDLACGEGAMQQVEGIPVKFAECRKTGSALVYHSYSFGDGKWRTIVQGLSGYDSALKLALRSLVADQAVAGEVSVVSTGTGGGLGSSKAALTDPDVIIGQGYRRNNAGAYAEAAELFEPVSGSPAASNQDDAAERFRREHEMKVNRALQLSNLGEFEQAAKIFGESRELGSRDPIQSRLSRNFEAIDAVNRGDLVAVSEILDRPVAPLANALVATGDGVRIDPLTAAGLNTGTSRDRASILGQEVKLTIPERAAIIDAQAGQLRGTALRLAGKLDEANARLVESKQCCGRRARRQGSIDRPAALADTVGAFGSRRG